MKQYAHYKVVGAKDLDKYTKKGWEIIGKEVSEIGPNQFSDYYHVGCPYQLVIDDLKRIIKNYEKYNLDQKLFETVAQENEEELKDLKENATRLIDDITKTSKFMNHYYDVVHNEIKSYGKIRKQTFDF